MVSAEKKSETMSIKSMIHICMQYGKNINITAEEIMEVLFHTDISELFITKYKCYEKE